MNKTSYIMIMAMAVMAWTGPTFAEPVDIGLGEMDRAEFNILRDMVNGDYQPSKEVKQAKTPEVFVAEFNWRDVEAIRETMSRGFSQEQSTVASSGTQVDIGLGSMETNEFCDLNKLVASNSNYSNQGFGFICP